MIFQKKEGFTLIELLIVVAIIGILAAIAIPNFLNAQVRSKVARTLADMRMLDLAYTQYQVDWNMSPIINNNDFPVKKVTTPIAYITSWPIDPFSTDEYFYVAPYWDLPPGGIWPHNLQWMNSLWPEFFVGGYGPFRPDTYKGLILPHNFIWGFAGIGPNRVIDLAVFQMYDPTNGTISDGDVWRCGPGG